MFKQIRLFLMAMFVLVFSTIAAAAEADIVYVTAVGQGETQREIVIDASKKAIKKQLAKELSDSKVEELEDQLNDILELEYAKYIGGVNQIQMVRKFRSNKFKLKIPVNEERIVALANTFK